MANVLDKRERATKISLGMLTICRQLGVTGVSGGGERMSSWGGWVGEAGNGAGNTKLGTIYIILWTMSGNKYTNE